MNWRRKFIVILASCFVSIFLAGCSGAPSSSDIEKTMRASVDEGNQQAKQFAGELSKGVLIQLHGAKKIGCVEAKASTGYNCDVELDLTTPFAGRKKSIVAIRFIETDDGWKALQ